MAKRNTAGLNDQKQSTGQEARRSAKGERENNSRVVKANAIANDSDYSKLEEFTKSFPCLPCT